MRSETRVGRVRRFARIAALLGLALMLALGVHGMLDYPYWYIPNLLIVLIALWVIRGEITPQLLNRSS